MIFKKKMSILIRILMNQNAILMALADISQDPKTKIHLMGFVEENDKLLHDIGM